MFALNNKIKSFLDEVCVHINCKAVHSDVREELCEHINELINENISNGYMEEQALDLAISAMGSTDEIGRKLNRQHKPQTEWSLLILTVIIASIGGIVMFSGNKGPNGLAVDLSHYIMFITAGTCTMIALYYFDYTRLQKLAIPLYISGILLLVITMGAGITANGVKKWLPIGSFSISVPELSCLLFVIAFAGFLEKYRGKSASNIIKLIVQGGFSVFLFTIMHSTSTAFVFVTACGVVLITAILKKHFSGSIKTQLLWLAAGCSVPALLCLYKVMAAPYILDRLLAFLPWKNSDPSGIGYQQYVANNWLSVSNWFGKTEATYQGYSLNMSLPAATDEYILVNVIATLGWVVGIALVMLIGIFIARMFMNTIKIKNHYGFYLSMSVCAILSSQFLFSILINFNLFPFMSINMPLVSYGGTGYLASMAYVGIILSVRRRDNLISNKKPVPNTPSPKSRISFSDGRLIIDLNRWRQG